MLISVLPHTIKEIKNHDCEPPGSNGFVGRCVGHNDMKFKEHFFSFNLFLKILQYVSDIYHYITCKKNDFDKRAFLL